MTTATDGREQARSFIHKRLVEMDEADRAAVIELFQLLDSDDCEEPEEVFETITELLLPDSFSLPAESDEADEMVKERVAAYRFKVGETIRALRHAKGMTQDELAGASGLKQSHICRLERGKHVATYVTIERLAKALGTTPSQIDPGFEG